MGREVLKHCHLVTRMAVELELIKGGRLLEQSGDRSGVEFLLQVRHGLAKRQIQKELHQADQVAAPAAAMAVEQILGGMDVERGSSLLVKGTQPDPLLAEAGTIRLPVVALQITPAAECVV